MVKGNTSGAAVQYKVHLKPTEIGVLVIRRMERPHADKSVELRRYIELGYAAEQAGFILDGAVLRHGGRVWDAQPDLSHTPAPSLAQSAELPAVTKSLPVARKAGPSEGGDKVNSASDGSSLADGQEGIEPSASALRTNLRGLSG